MFANAIGVISESIALNPQLKHVETAVPNARIRVGNTSAARTQLIGPKENEFKIVMTKNMATPARWAAILVLADAEILVPRGKEASSAARTANAHMSNVDPSRRGFFRPTRSMKQVIKLR